MAHPRPSAAENRGCDPESAKIPARPFEKQVCAGARELYFIWLEGVSPGPSDKTSKSLVGCVIIKLVHVEIEKVPKSVHDAPFGCVINELTLEVIESKSTSSKVRSSGQGFTISRAPLINQGPLSMKFVT